MKEQFQRTVQLIGAEACEKLSRSKVIVFGIGGVGSYVCEALARAGVGSIEIVDRDSVSASNINRQLIALHSTLGTVSYTHLNHSNGNSCQRYSGQNEKESNRHRERQDCSRQRRHLCA